MPTKDDAPERWFYQPGFAKAFVTELPAPRAHIPATEYVRADMLAALQADVERLTGERDEAMRRAGDAHRQSHADQLDAADWQARAEAAEAEVERLTKLDVEYGRVETAIIMADRDFDGDSDHASAGDRLVASVERLRARAEAAEAAGREKGIRDAAEQVKAVAAIFDHPSVYMGGPSRRAQRLADTVANEILALLPTPPVTPRWEAFGREVMEAWPEGGIDGGELQDIAVKHLVILKVPGGYDPRKHGESEWANEPGDEWFTRNYPVTSEGD